MTREYRTRVIIVEDQQVTGEICPYCESHLAIYPAELLDRHLERHADARRELEKLRRQLATRPGVNEDRRFRAHRDAP